MLGLVSNETFFCVHLQFIAVYFPEHVSLLGEAAAGSIEGIFCVRRNLLRGVISLSNCRVHCQGGRGRGRGACTSRSRCDYRPGAKKKRGQIASPRLIWSLRSNYAGSRKLGRAYNGEIRSGSIFIQYERGRKQKEIVFSGHGIGQEPRALRSLQFGFENRSPKPKTTVEV